MHPLRVRQGRKATRGKGMTRQLLKARASLQEAAIKEIVQSFEAVVIENFSRIYLADSLRPILGNNPTGADIEMIRERLTPEDAGGLEDYRYERRRLSWRHAQDAIEHIRRENWLEAHKSMKLAQQYSLRSSTKIELFRYERGGGHGS